MSGRDDNEPFTFAEEPEGGQPQQSAASSGAPGFDPFADVGDVAPARPDVAQPAAGGDEKTAGAGGNGFDPFADAGDQPQPEAAEDEAPARRDDLWACPHCGTRNKPDRDVCRNCGKSPDDPIERAPLTKQPWFYPSVIGGVLVLLWMLWSMSGPSLALTPPGPAGVDASARIGGNAGPQTTLSDGATFEAQRRLAVSGRVINVGSLNANVPVRSLYLVLAEDGSRLDDPDVWRQFRVRDNRDTDVTLMRDGAPNPKGFGLMIIHVIDQDDAYADISDGDWVSLTGQIGRADTIDIGRPRGAVRGEYVLLPQALKTR